MKTKIRLVIVWLAVTALMIVAAAALARPQAAMAESASPTSAEQSVQTEYIEEEDVIKVVNVTDGSYVLENSEYDIVRGGLVVDNGYLFTLESNATYIFRVVTAEKDYDFEIQTRFTSPTLMAGTGNGENFVRGQEVSFTLSESAVIYDVRVDGVSVEYMREGNKIVLDESAFSQMTAGEHTVKLFTSMGRPSLGFKLEGEGDDIWQEIIPINYTWFIIDMVIFGSAIAAYVAFAVIKKIQKKRMKAQG